MKKSPVKKPTPSAEAAAAAEISKNIAVHTDAMAEERVHLSRIADASSANVRKPDVLFQTDMAVSLKKFGQMSPIGLAPADNSANPKLSVIWGHTRLAAARQLGWTRIRAYILPLGTAAAALAAAENLDRQELDPAAEALAVQRVISATGSIAAAAAVLGRGEEWVRVRSYVSLLAPAVLERLRSRQLTLGHARVLATVRDMDQQIAIAEEVARKFNGGEWTMSVEKLRGLVEMERRDLKKVPWRLEVPFAGMPACRGCPANTSTDSLLFEDAVEEGRCANKSCFAKKMEVADHQIFEIQVAAEKAMTGEKNKDPKAPAWMKESSFKRAVDRGHKAFQHDAGDGADDGPGQKEVDREPAQDLYSPEILYQCAEAVLVACTNVWTWAALNLLDFAELRNPEVTAAAVAATSDSAFQKFATATRLRRGAEHRADQADGETPEFPPSPTEKVSNVTGFYLTEHALACLGRSLGVDVPEPKGKP